MNSHRLLNIALAVIVAILIILVVLEPGTEKQQFKKLAGDLNPENIDKLILERHGKLIVSLAKQQHGWEMLQPYKLHANDVQINALINIVNQNSYTQINKQQHELEKFGLTKPYARLQLNNKTFIFGGTDPLNFRRYVLVDDTIHLINDTMFQQLTLDAVKYVSFTLIPDNTKITRLVLPEITLIKNPETGGWKLTPDNSTLSQDKLNSIIEEWRIARAIEISPWASSNNATLDSDTPIEIDLDLNLDNNEHLQYLLIKDEQDLILGRKDMGIKYRLPGNMRNRLLQADVPENIPAKAQNQ